MGSPSNAIICAQMESPSIGGSVEGKRRLGRPPCQAPVRAWADVKGNDTGSIMSEAPRQVKQGPRGRRQFLGPFGGTWADS